MAVKVAQRASLPSGLRIKGLDDVYKKEWSSRPDVKKKQSRPLWNGDLKAPQRSTNATPKYPINKYPAYISEHNKRQSFAFLEKKAADPMKQALLNQIGSYQKPPS